MTLVEPSSPPTIPTHRRRLSLKILTNPFRRLPDASAHSDDQPPDPRSDEAVSASPLVRTLSKASSIGPKKLRRRSLSNIVKVSKPSGTREERPDEAAPRSTTVNWTKRTSGHPLPQVPPSLKTEHTTVYGALQVQIDQGLPRAEQVRTLPPAPLLVELDRLHSRPSTYSPDTPSSARPVAAALPPCTGLPFPSRPKPASSSALLRTTSGDVEHERIASSSSERRPQLSHSSSISSQASADMLAWSFPTPPLRYYSSPDSSVSSTPSSSPRRTSPSEKRPPASPRTRRQSDLAPTSPPRGPSSSSSSPVDPLARSSPTGSLATTTRKPITIRPQLGRPRVSASLLAKGIPVPAPAHGVQHSRVSTSPASTSRSPVQPGWTSTTSNGWPKPLLLVEGMKSGKGGDGRHGRSQSLGAPSSHGRGRSVTRGQGGRGEQGEQDTLEGDGMGVERRRLEAEADTMFTEARLKSLWAELGL